MKHLTFLLTLITLLIQPLMAASHIYVSPSGSDLNDGSRKHPLLTPVRALVKAREMPRRDTLFIHLADGVYRLDETLQLRSEDSGTPDAPTVIVADHPGKAIFSGGMQLDMSGRMESLNWWMGRPTVGHRTAEVRQLWRGDRKMPHASLVPFDSIIELKSIDIAQRELCVSVESFDPILDLIYGSRLGFAEDESIMNSVKAEEIQGLELIACTQRTMAVLRVKNFRVDGKTIRLTFHEPESRLLFSQPEMPLFFNLTGGYSLAFPGLWYQDPKDGSVVYYPEDEERSAGRNASVVGEPFTMAVLERLVQVSGQPADPVHHIIFRGISFMYSAWNRPSRTGVLTVPGGNFLLNGGYEERQEAAIVMRDAYNIEFADCEFRHLGATAIDYLPGCHHGSVTGCHFTDVGGSAIATPLAPAGLGFRIQRNTFEDLANEIWFSDAIRSK